MPDTVTKETVYAELDAVARLAEGIRDTIKLSFFETAALPYFDGKCLQAERMAMPLPPIPGPGCIPSGIKFKPEEIYQILQHLEIRVHKTAIDYAALYDLTPGS